MVWPGGPPERAFNDELEAVAITLDLRERQIRTRVEEAETAALAHPSEDLVRTCHARRTRLEACRAAEESLVTLTQASGGLRLRPVWSVPQKRTMYVLVLALLYQEERIPGARLSQDNELREQGAKRDQAACERGAARSRAA
jgi:hypothetical protein